MNFMNADYHSAIRRGDKHEQSPLRFAILSNHELDIG